jgi:hypothetical protein
MVDLIVPQITEAAVVPSGSAISIFDWAPIIGVPVWIFVDAVLLFALVAVIVWWMAKIAKLNAVRGWAESIKMMDVHDVQVWIISRTQKLVIDCMKIEDNVLSYHDTTKIGMWHHNTRESVIRVGGNPAVVVSEDYDQTRDIISEIALTDGADEFNANQTALIDWKKEQQIEGAVIEPINDYEDYETHGREALQLVYPDGLPLKSFTIFNNLKFLKYFPKGCSHMFFGGELELESRGLHQSESVESFWEKHTLLIVAGIIALAAMAAAWFVPLGG